MNWIKSILALCLFLGLSVTSYSQKLTEDVVYLKNGSTIRGQVTEYKPEGNIKIEIAGGSVLVYPATEVVEVKKEEAKIQATFHKKQRPLKVPEIGKMYYNFMGKLMTGINAFDGISGGIGAYYAMGYRFHRLASVGLGVGIERNDAFNLMPVFVDFRAYLMKSSASVYWSLGAGYSIALPTSSWRFAEIQRQTGGLYLHPAVGFRFKSREETHLMMDFGYTIQSNNITFVDQWSGNVNTQKNVLFRPSFRIGLVF